MKAAGRANPRDLVGSGFDRGPYSAVYVATQARGQRPGEEPAHELRGTGVRIWAACPGRTERVLQVALGEDQPRRAAPQGDLDPSRSSGPSSEESTAAKGSYSPPCPPGGTVTLLPLAPRPVRRP